MKKFLSGIRPMIMAGILYTIIAIIVVASAWAINLHAGDMSLTISEYIGLRQWTAFVYFLFVIVIDFLVFYYVANTKISTHRIFLYCYIFTCVFGCAFCPWNPEWSEASTAVHNVCANSMMVAAAIAFISSVVKPADKRHRNFTIGALVYSLSFILLYGIIGWQPYLDTLFIWENAFIYILITELCLERPKAAS